MAAQAHLNHLIKVGREAFDLIDQFKGRQARKVHQPPPPRSHEHHQSNYVYRGPQAVTVVQEPNAYQVPDIQVYTEMRTAAPNSYHGPEAFTVTKEDPKSNKGRRYVVQVPAAEDQPAVLNCQDAAGIYGGIRISDNGNFRSIKPQRN